MTTSVDAPDAPGTLTRAGRRRVTASLCLTQVVGWGVLFYAFPVLHGSIGADTGWSPVHVSAAFSLAQVVAAVSGIPVGRVIDRVGPRAVMTAGSATASLGLVVVAVSPGIPVFVAGWVVVGAAMGAVLYPPAFAAITHWHDGADRVRALMVLTVAGGLASTVFAPLTALLGTTLGWRGAYVVLAGVLALATVPGHAFGLRGPWVRTPTSTSSPRPVGDVLRSRPFVSLAVALSLTSATAYAVVVNLVPRVGEAGVGLGVASVLLGLGGIGQVVGRLGYQRVTSSLGVVPRTALVVGWLAMTTLLLGLVDRLAALVVLVVVAGLARGVLTLVQATAVTDRWGPRDYGHLSGVLAAPVALATAAAPWLGAWLAVLLGSHASAFVVLAVLNLVAVLFALASGVPKVAPDPADRTEVGST